MSDLLDPTDDARGADDDAATQREHARLKADLRGEFDYDPCPECGASFEEGCHVDSARDCPRGLDPVDTRDGASTADALTGLRGELAKPAETAGLYMVLWAKVPDQGVAPEHRYRPDWQEVGFIQASNRDVARARAIEHDGRSPKPFADRGPVARFLIAEAEKAGIMLRAVPAEYWPARVPVTGVEVPPPILTLGTAS